MRRPYARHDDRLREASGSITSEDRLQCFLYLILRDHLTAGVVEQLVAEIEGMRGDEEVQEFAFTNGWVAAHAADLAAWLR